MRFRKYTPTVLSLLAVGGVVLTVIQAIKDYNKCQTKIKTLQNDSMADKIIVVTPCFIPTISLAAGTIACILGANTLNQRNQAILISALESVKAHYGLYRREVIKRYGKEADEEIEYSICRLHSNGHITDLDCPDSKILFMEPYSRIIFEAYERTIMDAEYHFNRNYALTGVAHYNDFLDMLKIAPVSGSDTIGWDFSSGLVWVDFFHRMEKHNGKDVCVIYTEYPPDEIDEDYL